MSWRDGFNAGAWRGLCNYECKDCTFSTVEAVVAESHWQGHKLGPRISVSPILDAEGKTILKEE